MVRSNRVDDIAVLVVEVFLVLLGLKLEEFDENDPNCIRNNGVHRIYSVCGRSNAPIDNFDIQKISELLTQFLDEKNHSYYGTIVHLDVYDVQAYPDPSGGTSLYLSVVST